MVADRGRPKSHPGGSGLAVLNVNVRETSMLVAWIVGRCYLYLRRARRRKSGMCDVIENGSLMYVAQTVGTETYKAIAFVRCDRGTLIVLPGRSRRARTRLRVARFIVSYRISTFTRSGRQPVLVGCKFLRRIG